MNVLNWNLEWASKRSARGREISRIIASHEPAVMCLTELTLGMLPESGHPLIADGSSGYPGPANRRKVALWSNDPWTEPDLIGHPDLPGGRFASGVSTASASSVSASRGMPRMSRTGAKTASYPHTWTADSDLKTIQIDR